MVQLVSPGIAVSVSTVQSVPAVAAGTVPTIFLATASNKLLSDGVTIAPGTLPANAGKIYTLTSQRELLQTFGNPFFNIVDGTVQQGDETNEVGLHAAWSYLGLANSVNVIRADLDVSQLLEKESEPTAAPANGTYWFDYTNSSFGAFRANGNPIAGLAWNQLAVLTPTLDQVDGSGVPLATFGSAGNLAVVTSNSNNEIEMYEKISTLWYLVGSPAWRAARPTVLMGTVQVPGTIDAAGSLVINGTTVNILSSSTVLHTAANFAALAGAAVTNTGASALVGDVGATSAITGMTSATVTGVIHAVNDAATIQALVDATSAYTALNALSATPVVGDLGGQTLTPGVYSSSVGTLTGTLTLNFQNLSNQKIVITTPSTLVTASASSVIIENSDATNSVYFVVGQSATLGTGTSFAGTIIANISISMGSGATITNGNAIALSGSVTMIDDTVSAAAAATLATLITDINTAAIANITASAGGLANEQLVITNTAGLGITISGTPAVLTALGTPALTTPGYNLVFAPNTSVPSGLHAGDIWIKTTNPNFGANFVIKMYNSSVSQFQTVSAPLYVDDVAAEVAQGLSLGELYVQYNTLGTSTSPEATFVIKKLASLAAESVSATFTTPAAGTFNITSRASAGLAIGTHTVVPVTFVGTETAAQAVTAINAAIATSGAVPHIVASSTGSQITITSNNGSAVNLQDSTGHASWALTGLPIGVFSNWIELPYTASINAPTTIATEGTLWFNPSLNVDIMVNNGNQWVGYLTMYPATDPNGPQVTSAQPTTQSNGNPLQNNDLWIQSDNVVGYPAIYVFLNGAWSLVDNTDHTTPMGVVFGDVRQDSGPALSGNTAPWLLTVDSYTAQPKSIAPEDLLRSDYVDPVDLQVLNPQIFPAGILLFNTEIGSDNVKVRRNSYFSGVTTSGVAVGTFLNAAYETAHPGSQEAVVAYLNANPGRWISQSGNDNTGTALMGSFAQRAVVVTAIAAQIVGNEAVQDPNLYFNLLAAPGYVELFADLVTLNVDRQETAFIITDVPATLTPDATSINNWAKDAANVATDGRLGRITAYDYAAMYYPWGLGTNVDGTSVAIPSSTIALNVYGYNDRVGYPWTPPAGTRRGIVNNASSVGYIDINTHEYVPYNVNKGQRDTLYTNNINPILFIPGQGLLVRGDKTLTADATGLTTRVNVARTVVYLNYILPQLFESFLFELNTPQTRASAYKTATSFLTTLVGQGALTDFAVVCDSSNNTPESIAANELYIDIAVVPTFAIDFIYIPVALQVALTQ